MQNIKKINPQLKIKIPGNELKGGHNSRSRNSNIFMTTNFSNKNKILNTNDQISHHKPQKIAYKTSKNVQTTLKLTKQRCKTPKFLSNKININLRKSTPTHKFILKDPNKKSIKSIEIDKIEKNSNNAVNTMTQAQVERKIKNKKWILELNQLSRERAKYKKDLALVHDPKILMILTSKILLVNKRISKLMLYLNGDDSAILKERSTSNYNSDIKRYKSYNTEENIDDLNFSQMGKDMEKIDKYLKLEQIKNEIKIFQMSDNGVVKDKPSYLFMRKEVPGLYQPSSSRVLSGKSNILLKVFRPSGFRTKSNHNIYINDKINFAKEDYDELYPNNFEDVYFETEKKNNTLENNEINFISSGPYETPRKIIKCNAIKKGKNKGEKLCKEMDNEIDKYIENENNKNQSIEEDNQENKAKGQNKEDITSKPNLKRRIKSLDYKNNFIKNEKKSKIYLSGYKSKSKYSKFYHSSSKDKKGEHLNTINSNMSQTLKCDLLYSTILPKTSEILQKSRRIINDTEIIKANIKEKDEQLNIELEKMHQDSKKKLELNKDLIIKKKEQHNLLELAFEDNQIKHKVFSDDEEELVDMLEKIPKGCKNMFRNVYKKILNEDRLLNVPNPRIVNPYDQKIKFIKRNKKIRRESLRNMYILKEHMENGKEDQVILRDKSNFGNFNTMKGLTFLRKKSNTLDIKRSLMGAFNPKEKLNFNIHYP